MWREIIDRLLFILSSAHGAVFGERCDVKVLFVVDYYTDIGELSGGSDITMTP